MWSLYYADKYNKFHLHFYHKELNLIIAIKAVIRNNGSILAVRKNNVLIKKYLKEKKIC